MFTDNDPNADDEFLPEMSEETMNQLNEAYSLLLHEKTGNYNKLLRFINHH